MTRFTEDDLSTVILIGNLAAVEIARSISEERLRRAQSELEEKVLERTASLLETKEKLEKEIIDRENIEQALIESEKRYRSLVEGENDIIFSCDVYGNFTLINPFTLEITGFSREEIFARRYVDFIQFDYKDEVEEFYARQLKEKIPDTYKEYPIVSKDGQILWLGKIVQLIREGDRIVGFQRFRETLPNVKQR